MNIEHKDYFGKLIEVGDEILRTRFSELEKRKVCRITPTAVYVHHSHWSYKTKGTVNAELRLDVEWYKNRIINLTKLNKHD
jgi:hypothetical protein